MSKQSQDDQLALQTAQQIAYNREREPVDPHPPISLPDQTRPVHSPLGASGAERWLQCPGSVTLLKHLDLEESDEPDYRVEGSAAHEAAAKALREGLDAWELVGETFLGITLTPELANPLQMYLDYCRIPQGQKFVEYGISSPVHPQFYGTLDFGCYAANVLVIVDLKFGQGIAVDVEDNPQLKYYAFGLIDGMERQSRGRVPDELPVMLTIVQPRGFHVAGPVREWETTVGAIRAWVHDVLVPAMQATEFEDSLKSGDWCRFCPAKLACPLLTDLFKAACLSNPKHLPDQSDAAIGENYRCWDGVKHYGKALEAEAFARAMRGRAIPHTKLVHKKANRTWKDGAPALAEARFGLAAFTAPELKSPAELEKLPEAGQFVKEFAYSPDTGLTLALETDSRQAVTVQDPKERFREQLTASVEQEDGW